MKTKLYLYTNLLEEEAKAASSFELERALELFWRKTGLCPEKVCKTEKGKPYFPSGGVYLSVTHTGPFYAVAFAFFPIGIDAEKESVVKKRIAERKFTPEEQKLPFSHVWCGKEAVAKLVGDGLEIVGKVSVSENFAEYAGKDYSLQKMTFGDTLLVIATEKGVDYGTETLSEK